MSSVLDVVSAVVDSYARTATVVFRMHGARKRSKELRQAAALGVPLPLHILIAQKKYVSRVNWLRSPVLELPLPALGCMLSLTRVTFKMGEVGVQRPLLLSVYDV